MSCHSITPGALLANGITRNIFQGGSAGIHLQARRPTHGMWDEMHSRTKEGFACSIFFERSSGMGFVADMAHSFHHWGGCVSTIISLPRSMRTTRLGLGCCWAPHAGPLKQSIAVGICMLPHDLVTVVEHFLASVFFFSFLYFRCAGISLLQLHHPILFSVTSTYLLRIRLPLCSFLWRPLVLASLFRCSFLRPRQQQQPSLPTTTCLSHQQMQKGRRLASQGCRTVGPSESQCGPPLSRRPKPPSRPGQATGIPNDGPAPSTPRHELPA